MPVIDFTEIPVANQGGEDQDSFELFAREFLEKIGFRILEGPDRGSDGGRDLIVSEVRQGIVADTAFRWLVSCKHNAHSAKSVCPNDENNISDRIQTHGCNGFIGFYSTIPSSGLSNMLKGIKKNNSYEIMIFDNEKIERLLLEDVRLDTVFKRFFPRAYEISTSKRLSNLLEKYCPLCCEVCGKDLLHEQSLDKYKGIIVFSHDYNYSIQNDGKRKYIDVYCVCKGECDIKKEQWEHSRECLTTWNDISDLIIPIEYLKFMMGILNNICYGIDSYTDEAFEKLKQIIICISQVALRRQTKKEIQRSIDLSSLPDGI